jgi:hypothetical protein
MGTSGLWTLGTKVCFQCCPGDAGVSGVVCTKVLTLGSQTSLPTCVPFLAFNFRLPGALTETEFVLGVAAMDPETLHGAQLLRPRLFLVFRLYDQNHGEVVGVPASASKACEACASVPLYQHV